MENEVLSMKGTELTSFCGGKRPHSASADASLQVTAGNLAHVVLLRPLLGKAGYCENNRTPTEGKVLQAQVRAGKGCSPVWDVPGHQRCVVASAGSQIWDKLDSLLLLLEVAEALLPSSGTPRNYRRTTTT